ncbi:MAG: NMD3-related protein, partial [Candidatus Micrarchaeaceae archaeon]
NCEVEGGERVAFEKKLRFKKTHEMCTDCFRRRSGYFEAIVQLRGDKFLIGRMFSRITSFMEKHNAFVAKTEEHDFGVDMYLSDKAVANEFFKESKLKPDRSYVLFGMKKGRRLFRNIYSLKL